MVNAIVELQLVLRLGSVMRRSTYLLRSWTMPRATLLPVGCSFGSRMPSSGWGRGIADARGTTIAIRVDLLSEKKQADRRDSWAARKPFLTFMQGLACFVHGWLSKLDISFARPYHCFFWHHHQWSSITAYFSSSTARTEKRATSSEHASQNRQIPPDNRRILPPPNLRLLPCP